MLVKSARTVYREFYPEKTFLHWDYFLWLAEGVPTTLCCCAKLVFMLLPSAYGVEQGFSNYGSRPQMG